MKKPRKPDDSGFGYTVDNSLSNYASSNYQDQTYNSSWQDGFEEEEEASGALQAEAFDPSCYGAVDVGSESYEMQFSISSSLEQDDEVAELLAFKQDRDPVEVEKERNDAKEAYSAYRAARFEEQARKELAEQSASATGDASQGDASSYLALSPYTFINAEDNAQEVEEDSEFQDKSLSERSFDTEEALAWYLERNDQIKQAARVNSLMGWEKGEDGGWRQSGQAPQAAGRAKEMHDKHGVYQNEHLNAAFRDQDRGAGNEHKPKFQGSQALADTPDAEVVGHNTRYLSEEEQKQAEVSVKGGKLLGAQGKRVDTTAASGKGTFFEGGAGRFIYNKDVDGTLRAAGAWEGHTEMQHDAWYDQTYGRESTPEEIEARDKNKIQMSFMNHSSLNAGRDSRGAGELLVEDGDVKMVTDNSGHYQTDGERLYDTVSGLANDGAATEGMSVGMVNKDQDDKKARLLAIKRAKEETQGRGAKLGDLVVGANEFLAYGGAADAEQKMRGARQDRLPMMQALQGFDRSSLKQAQTNDRSAADLSGKGGRVSLMRERFEQGGADAGPKVQSQDNGDRVSRLRAMFEQQ